MLSDLAIAQAAKIKPILEVAEGVGLTKDDLVPYGWDKAKVRLDVLDRLGDRPNAKYIDVTAITPTPLGEGKTTTTVGLSQALSARARRRRSLPASASHRWDPPLASRAALRAAAIRRSSPWRISTST